MIEYKRFFKERLPIILNNMATNYTVASGYITLDDTKRKVYNDLFIVRRAIRRFIMTMHIERMNTLSSMVVNQLVSILRSVEDAYREVRDAKSVDEISSVLNRVNNAFMKIKDPFSDLIDMHSASQRRYSGYTDFDKARDVGEFDNTTVGVTQHFMTRAPFVNMFIPFDEEDHNYVNFKPFIEQLTMTANIHNYGFISEQNSEQWNRIYYKGLNTSWNHCDVRYNTFDAVFMTYESAYNLNHGQFKRGYNYLKNNGTMILFALASDFIPNQLERLSVMLHDIHVYFFSHSSAIREDVNNPFYNDFVIIAGKKGRSDDILREYDQLLYKFFNSASDDTDFEMIGSSEDVAHFRSYELTEEEYLELAPLLPRLEHNTIESLFPKSSQDTRRPLLPFSSGQLGLVLISGDVNGVIRETDTGCCHTVKGFSGRDSQTREEEVLNDKGIQVGRKRIRVNFPTTNVKIIVPDGNILQVKG